MSHMFSDPMTSSFKLLLSLILADAEEDSTVYKTGGGRES